MKKLFLFILSTFYPLLALTAESESTRMLNEKSLSKNEVLASCLKIELGESKLDCTTCKVVGIKNIGDVDGQNLSIAKYEYFWAKDSGLKECGYGTIWIIAAAGASRLHKWEPL